MSNKPASDHLTDYLDFGGKFFKLTLEVCDTVTFNGLLLLFNYSFDYNKNLFVIQKFVSLQIAEILIAVIWAVNICCLIRNINNGKIDPQNLDDQNKCQKNQVINFNSCFCTPLRNNTSETQCKFKNSNNASNEIHSI